jgi:hypothetical protein
MANEAVAEKERMRRFRDAALPHLDDVYTLARYLMRPTTPKTPCRSAACGPYAISTAIEGRR